MQIPETETLVDKLAHKKFFIALFTNLLLSRMYAPENDWRFNVVLVVGMIGIAMGTVICQMIQDNKDEPIRE